MNYIINCQNQIKWGAVVSFMSQEPLGYTSTWRKNTCVYIVSGYFLQFVELTIIVSIIFLKYYKFEQKNMLKNESA